MNSLTRRFRAARARRQRAERGQALVEVAIALPILLALFVGIFEFARAYNVQQVITNAAREGARYAVLPTSSSASDVQDTVASRLADANVTAKSITVSGIGGSTGLPVQVTVEVDYTFRFIGPILKLLTPGASDPGTITLRSTSTMRKE